MMDFSLPLRALQFLFAILVLGFTAYEVSWYNEHSIWSTAPSQINFLLFVALFTLLCVLYLALAPRFAPRASHPFAILALDGILWVFWFAGWVALAVFHHRLNLCWGNVCHVMVAAIVIGALEWAMFSATLAFAALAARHGQGKSGTTTTSGAGWPRSTQQTAV